MKTYQSISVYSKSPWLLIRLMTDLQLVGIELTTDSRFQRVPFELDTNKEVLDTLLIESREMALFNHSNTSWDLIKLSANNYMSVLTKVLHHQFNETYTELI